MRYNVKLTIYPNTATIAVYDELVGMDEGFERRKYPPQEPKTYINPFTGELLTDDDILEDEVTVYERKMTSIDSSIKRTKRKILCIMRSLDMANSYFVTLTFDSRKVERTNYDICCKKARVWFQNLRKCDGAEDMSFICVPELHKDMESWHLHAVICNPGNIPLIDSGHKDRKGRTIFNITGWRYGFSTAIKLDGSDPMTSIKLSKYVTKYITKESELIAKNRHRYFASQNIPTPKTHTWTYETKEELDRILEQIKSQGYEFISENEHEGYVTVNYIEAIKT